MMSRATVDRLLKTTHDGDTHIDACVRKVNLIPYSCRIHVVRTASYGAPRVDCPCLLALRQTQGGEWCWWHSDWAVSQCVADTGTPVEGNFSDSAQPFAITGDQNPVDWNSLFMQNCVDGDIRTMVTLLVLTSTPELDRVAHTLISLLELCYADNQSLQCLYRDGEDHRGVRLSPGLAQSSSRIEGVAYVPLR